MATIALIGRQIRITQQVHDALQEAVTRGEQNKYIVAALTRALQRDGFLGGLNGADVPLDEVVATGAARRPQPQQRAAAGRRR